jgi:hypothetical protein
MRSCIGLFYICALGAGLQAQDADVLYAQRTNVSAAVQAAGLWSAELARNPSAFDAAWKLARACYWLGGHAAPADRRGYLERGMAAARTAAGLQPARPEGHFWMAANMGSLAEASALRAGLKYRGAIKRSLETVRRIDPAFMNGSADRALGRWYAKVPRLFGGSARRAEEHFRASLEYDARSTVSHFFLAELLIEEGRLAEARRELQAVLDAGFEAAWAPEDAEYKRKAAALLAELSRREGQQH